MGLRDNLSEKKKEIVGKWVSMVLDTYQSADFFKTRKNQFANPVGNNIARGLQEIFEILVEGGKTERLQEALDNIIRMRAVQDFAPSLALSFVFMLKDVIRQELAGKGDDPAISDLLEFEAAIDRAALIAFDIYMACRERLFQIRIRELQNGTSVLTDGTQCASAWLKRKLSESADNNKINSST
jgi:hypothetical protein